MHVTTLCAPWTLIWTFMAAASFQNAGAETNRDANSFYSPPVSRAAGLPENGLYPAGRKLAFLGYSGKPERDLTNGFTIAGPVYGNQMPYLEQCFTNGWPVVAHIGPRISFLEKSPSRYKLNETELRSQIAAQLQSLAGHKEIVWWAITPEELRPWRPDEMKCLDIVTETIRSQDPLHRPIYHYNPNHRTAETLLPIARRVDILGKGCYVNSVGYKRNRAWVRWSVEQEIQALRQAGRSNSIPIVMPELCKDPEPGEDKEIWSWVRHDVYLGMCSGAKGVFIWSLFKRKEVSRTWQIWYDAYAECARELNGKAGLSQIFLFGQPRADFKINPLTGATVSPLSLGGSAEPTTTSVKERAKREIKFPAWTSAEFAYGADRWLFLVSSANTKASFTVEGWPKGSQAVDAFEDTRLLLAETGLLQLDLPAYGVKAIRFSHRSASIPAPAR